MIHTASTVKFAYSGNVMFDNQLALPRVLSACSNSQRLNRGFGGSCSQKDIVILSPMYECNGSTVDVINVLPSKKFIMMMQLLQGKIVMFELERFLAQQDSYALTIN
ncbi:PREDICTED: uncharacterized protein LOC109205538 [Nicotiana attenuata]|uniref:uncharacterized protein LOC109205538 n=1 Tax=Nicotiana attenuata TaxID=49451 RepID=UPI0009054DCA|nr:PREDICTED: uncharacterized protein LOC109205538 [Nicotiana attenuata]